MDEKAEMEQGIIEMANRHPGSAKAQFLRRVVTGDETPSEVEIVDMLESLAELQAQRAILASEYSEQIARLEAYRDEVCADVDEEIEALRSAIKAATIEHGKSVKASMLQASWSKPRIKWDDKALCGYATAGHPELFAFRDEGKPSCSIRARR